MDLGWMGTVAVCGGRVGTLTVGQAQQETPAVRLAGVLPGRSVGWWVKVGSVGPLPVGPSGRVWNGSQSSRGAIELVSRIHRSTSPWARRSGT